MQPHSKLPDGRSLLAGLLVAFAATLPVSIALAQVAGYGAAAVWIILVLTGKLSRPSRLPLGRSMLLFVVIAVLVSLVAGARPMHSLEKLDRLFLLCVIPAILSVYAQQAGAVGQPGVRLLVAFLIGTGINAALDLVRIPTEMNLGTPLFETGNMRDPQFYMVALCLFEAHIMMTVWTMRKPVTTAGLVLTGLGLLLHFKRGTWISFFAASSAMAWLGRSVKLALCLLLLVAAALAMEPVRDRIAMMRTEFSGELGGRYLLWKEVTPVLFKAHPHGMGWKAPRHEDLAAVHPDVQKGLNHLHNNLLQLRLELGWPGLAAWLFWMGSFGLLTIRGLLQARVEGDRSAGAVFLGSLCGFLALMVNGMVEYNFGDGEIFMLLILLMGGCVVTRVRQTAGTPV